MFSQEGSTALQFAAIRVHTEAVKILVAAGAHLDIQNKVLEYVFRYIRTSLIMVYIEPMFGFRNTVRDTVHVRM